ncbi:MAG: hypothetical protein U9P14_09115, partial [Gemmatimonadota bacterium]|nr:hypothetical protein [Gemmatimonadota bacterium]
VYSYRLGRSKPDPQIFSGVLDVLVSQGLAAGDALYIGNDMLNDVATAGSAGFATVLFAGDRHSLNLRLGEERVRGVKPTAVISSYGQLPLMISGAAATSGRTLRLGILHHHLLPGGVSSVIRDTLEALAQHGAYQRVQADLFADLSRADGQAPGWVEELGGLKGLSLKAHHLPQLAYDRSLSEDRAHFLSEAEKQRDLLIDKIRLESCDLDNPYVLYIHNTALGKNPCLSAGLALFAEWAARERLPLLILNQTHDFAELHRPGQERIWRMATPGMDETERLRWEFPALPNMVHAGLTVADRRRLISTGLPAGATHVLPNSVGESWTAVREQVPAITDSLGGRPYLLAPQKVMRRKNTLEALVVLACLRSAGFDCGLVVTLPASSEADRKYEELVRAAVEETGLPAIIGIERTLGDKAPPFEQVVAGCAAFLTASVMEGFGQSFLEGWVAGRMVLGRRIEDPCSDFEDAGVDLGHLYRKLLVRPEWITGGLEALKQEYRTALGALRSELGFPPLKARQFEQQFARHKVFGHKGLRLVDFADLSPGMQAGVACLVAGDRGLCSQALELNPWVNSCVPGASGQWEELIKRNRQAVLRSFGPAVRARRLRSIILAGTAAMVTPENPVPGKRSLKEVLSETVSLEKTRLLFLQA